MAGGGYEIKKAAPASWKQLAAIGTIQRPLTDSVETEVAWFAIGDAQFATHPGETAPYYGLETLPGNSQFGHTFDPWAHQLMNENARPLRASNVSVMPEGLENSVSVEQMRDLLAFLKKGR